MGSTSERLLSPIPRQNQPVRCRPHSGRWKQAPPLTRAMVVPPQGRPLKINVFDKQSRLQPLRSTRVQVLGRRKSKGPDFRAFLLEWTNYRFGDGNDGPDNGNSIGIVTDHNSWQPRRVQSWRDTPRI